MNEPVNLIDESADDARHHARAAKALVNQSAIFDKYLKSVRLQYLQSAANAACLAGDAKASEWLHKADAVAMIYEHLFGAPQ
jgi:hypothetical protein